MDRLAQTATNRQISSRTVGPVTMKVMNANIPMKIMFENIPSFHLKRQSLQL